MLAGQEGQADDIGGNKNGEDEGGGEGAGEPEPSGFDGYVESATSIGYINVKPWLWICGIIRVITLSMFKGFDNVPGKIVGGRGPRRYSNALRNRG